MDVETSRAGAVIQDVRGDFFSSPRVVRIGEACGSDGTPGVEPTRTDNVRSITLAAPYAAAYRKQVVPDGERPAGLTPVSCGGR